MYITRIWMKRQIGNDKITTADFFGRYDLEIVSLSRPIQSETQITIPNVLLKEYYDKPMDIIIQKDQTFMVMFDPPFKSPSES